MTTRRPLKVDCTTWRTRSASVPTGTPSFREGKITRLHEWLAALGRRFADFEETWFYSDSHNDLPLLEKVTHPVAVDADDTLAQVATERDWLRISLRG